jgi:ABC-type microcin C transport system permease subunit YejE
MFLIILVEAIKYSSVFEVEPSMAISVTILPEAFVDIAMLLPSILSVSVSEIE